MDKRLNFKSRMGLSFLEWVWLYNGGKGLDYPFVVSGEDE